MKFKELHEMLQLKLKKSCRLTKELNGWLPSENDYVVILEDHVDTIFSEGLEVTFENNTVISVKKY